MDGVLDENELYSVVDVLVVGGTEADISDAARALHAHSDALRDRVAELEGEVVRLTKKRNDVRDVSRIGIAALPYLKKLLVETNDAELADAVIAEAAALQERVIDHREEANVMYDRYKRVLAERDAAAASADAAERECKQIKAWAEATIAASDTACEKWKVRAAAAEAREAGLREALASLIPCADLGKCGCDAYTEHEHFTGACGPVVQLKPTGKPCRCEACLARAALAAAPAKEVK